ncbi:MAG: tRNA guanosine(34) transglycosylase Tgt [Planctomycetes bacterium]|nr:tRNA guanosine(34) transglycosylase Tgt [Planctomycetota bacterium]
MTFAFRVETRDGRARTGSFATPHGDVTTPAFMPVGTRATVKGVGPDELRALGTQMLLANTYHLALRPGAELVRELGGLHRFMGWNGPILTDSGGYQIFSLQALTAIDEDGATIRSVVDGAKLRFTPESVMGLERALGADVIMALDHCPSDPSNRPEVEAATERTHRWLARCVADWRAHGGDSTGQALFGIVQGGAFDDLRARSVAAVTAHDLPGYAIGGVSVGEDRAAMRRAVEAAAPLLPAEKPRYLMGVGTPLDLYEAVRCGVDLFDCVTPTRHGRNHQAFTWEGRLNLRNAVHERDPRPLEEDCDCPACTRFSRAYLRHLCMAGEMLAAILLTQHNLRFFHRCMGAMRAAIERGSLLELESCIARAQARGPSAGPT